MERVGADDDDPAIQLLKELQEVRCVRFNGSVCSDEEEEEKEEDEKKEDSMCSGDFSPHSFDIDNV